MRVNNEIIIPVQDSAHPLQRVSYGVEGQSAASPIVTVSDANSGEVLKKIPITSDSTIQADIDALQTAVNNLNTSLGNLTGTVNGMKPYTDRTRDYWMNCKYCPNLNDLWVSGLFWWEPKTVGLPEANTWGLGLCVSNQSSNTDSNWTFQLARPNNDINYIYTRQSINTGGWTTWRKICESDSGWQTFSSGGWTGGYRKVNHFVHLTVQSASTTSSGWIVCPYILPAGYRPSMFSGRDNVQGVAYGNDVIGNNICRWYIGTDGKIQVAHYGGANTWVDFTATYYAG